MQRKIFTVDFVSIPFVKEENTVNTYLSNSRKKCLVEEEVDLAEVAEEVDLEGTIGAVFSRCRQVIIRI